MLRAYVRLLVFKQCVRVCSIVIIQTDDTYFVPFYMDYQCNYRG